MAPRPLPGARNSPLPGQQHCIFICWPADCQKWRLVCWHLEQNHKKVGNYRCQHPIHPHLLAICRPQGCRPGRGEVQAKRSLQIWWTPIMYTKHTPTFLNIVWHSPWKALWIISRRFSISLLPAVLWKRGVVLEPLDPYKGNEREGGLNATEHTEHRVVGEWCDSSSIFSSECFKNEEKLHTFWGTPLFWGSGYQTISAERLKLFSLR